LWVVVGLAAQSSRPERDHAVDHEIPERPASFSLLLCAPGPWFYVDWTSMLLSSSGRRQALFLAFLGAAGGAHLACGEGSIEAVGHKGASGGAGSVTVSSTQATGSTSATSTTAGVSGSGTTVSGSSATTTDGAGGSGSSSGGAGGSQVNPGAGGASGGASSGAGGSSGAPGNGGAAGSGPSGAWRPFSDASPWNTPIAQAPALDTNSDALVADLAASSASTPFIWINIREYSIPVYWADASTPRQNVSVTVLAGQGFGSGTPTSAAVPIPAGAVPAAGTDRHLCIIDKQTHTEWGMWDASSSSTGWTCSVAATADLAGTGVRPPKTGNPMWWTSPGARACGFPLSAGLITVEEIRRGKIDHALVIAYPHMRSHWYRPPASTAQPTTDQALPTRGVPCGGRLQLDPSIDVNGLPLSASGKTIARALQEYGAFVGDFSGAISLYADASPDALAAWNAGLLQNIELNKLDLKKFRVLAIGAMLEDTN
jgi:hypothetical protein